MVGSQCYTRGPGSQVLNAAGRDSEFAGKFNSWLASSQDSGIVG